MARLALNTTATRMALMLVVILSLTKKALSTTGYTHVSAFGDCQMAGRCDAWSVRLPKPHAACANALFSLFPIFAYVLQWEMTGPDENYPFDSPLPPALAGQSDHSEGTVVTMRVADGKWQAQGVNPITGARLWDSNLTFYSRDDMRVGITTYPTPGTALPTASGLGGELALFLIGATPLWALTTADGRLAWSWELASNYTLKQVASGGNRIYLLMEQEPSDPAWQPWDGKPSTIVALDAADGREVWAVPTSSLAVKKAASSAAVQYPVEWLTAGPGEAIYSKGNRIVSVLVCVPVGVGRGW